MRAHRERSLNILLTILLNLNPYPPILKLLLHYLVGQVCTHEDGDRDVELGLDDLADKLDPALRQDGETLNKLKF